MLQYRKAGDDWLDVLDAGGKLTHSLPLTEGAGTAWIQGAHDPASQQILIRHRLPVFKEPFRQVQGCVGINLDPVGAQIGPAVPRRIKADGFRQVLHGPAHQPLCILAARAVVHLGDEPGKAGNA